MFFSNFILSIPVTISAKQLPLQQLQNYYLSKTTPEVGNPTPGPVIALFYLSELVAVVVGIVGGRLLKFNRVQPTV